MFKLIEKEVVKEWERHLSDKFNVSVIQTDINEGLGMSSEAEDKIDPKHSKKTK